MRNNGIKRGLGAGAFAIATCTLFACGDATQAPGGNGTQQASVSGEKVYQQFCFSCHAAGVANAPKIGDAEAWAPLVAKGYDVLLQNSIEGVPPGMPPQGLCSQCTEEEMMAAIEYMAEQSGEP